MKKVFNKVVAIAATLPLAMSQGFAVMTNAVDAKTINVESVLAIAPQELESDWGTLAESALIDNEGRTFEVDADSILDVDGLSEKNASYADKVKEMLVGNPTVTVKDSVVYVTANVDATSYVESNVIQAIKDELTEQGAEEVIDDIDFSMLYKKGTVTGSASGNDISNTKTGYVTGAVFVDSDGNTVTPSGARAYLTNIEQELENEVINKVNAWVQKKYDEGIIVEIDTDALQNIFKTYENKIDKAYDKMNQALNENFTKTYDTADEAIAAANKKWNDEYTTRFTVPTCVADLAQYSGKLTRAQDEVNKNLNGYQLAFTMDDIMSTLNSGSDFTVSASAGVYTVTFQVPDEGVDEEYFSTVEGITAYYTARPDQATADGVDLSDTEALSKLEYDSSYKLVTAKGDANAKSGYFNVERYIQFKEKETTTTTTTATTTATTDVTGETTTTDVTGVTTTGTDVTGETTTDVTGETTATTDVTGVTTGTDVTGETTTDVTGTDVTGETTTDVTGTDVTGETTTDVTGTDVTGETTTDVTGTDVTGETTTTDVTDVTTVTTVSGITNVTYEFKDSTFYLSVDTREFKASDLFSKVALVNEDGTETDILDQVDFNGATPATTYNKSMKYYAGTIQAYYNGEALVGAAPTVYIGVKGDTNLNGLVEVADAVDTLTYYAKVAANQSDVVFNDDEMLNKLAYFLSDIDTESELGQNDAASGKIINVDDAVNILTYYAKKAANQDPNWANDVCTSLKSLEGSIWYEG